jgi:hypothetical protein
MQNLILLVVEYGCETLSLGSREKYRPTVCENRVQGSILGLKGKEERGILRNCITRILITCAVRQI